MLAGARGVTIRGNEVNGAGALILGPPSDKSVWMAEDVQFGSNARFNPEVHLLPLNSLGEDTTLLQEKLVRKPGSCNPRRSSTVSPASFLSSLLHTSHKWSERKMSA